ncbi:uncharacterized protein LOC133817568 [Humulus lupulus]|uniref:uncharacterized protein LOC133817568 n=1 Tax=Humulus lupulus TaxID=3486 RepID=UPI002B415D2D|nr:uncharacterized protein LOC133817568 [Humulus lupulus]
MYESFLRQRSKITWLRFGDENTSYFHDSLKQRKIGNRITSFVNDAGQLNDNNEEVVAYFINHFKGFFGSSSLASTRVEQECFQQGVVLTLEQQLGLLMPFTKKDVKKSLFSIHSIKSPRPNGYGTGFYKSLWKDIGDEILEAILTFFDRGEIPHELNNTIISLIPKWIMACLTGTSYTILMNGRLQGSFDGRKGLRQGDPISPLLFVLVMEYLTRLLNLATQHKEFRFHPMCNIRSIQILFDGFTKFSQNSGLTANLYKSQVYFGGISAEVKNNILNYVNIEEGSFPLKYLGVTLRPTKWKAVDCGVIIKKKSESTSFLVKLPSVIFWEISVDPFCFIGHLIVLDEYLSSAAKCHSRN